LSTKFNPDPPDLDIPVAAGKILTDKGLLVSPAASENIDSNTLQ
jgi:hypothetical protein